MVDPVAQSGCFQEWSKQCSRFRLPFQTVQLSLSQMTSSFNSIMYYRTAPKYCADAGNAAHRGYDICLKLSLLLPSPQRAVGLLLRRGAEANARDKFWQTPLHVATANRATRCAEALLTQLSNLNMADRTGRTALHHAAQSGFQEVRLQLFPSPMAVSHRTQNRATPGFCL